MNLFCRTFSGRTGDAGGADRGGTGADRCGCNSWKDENHGKTAYFASINSAKFKRKVVPGDILTLETEIIKVKGPIGVGKATAKVGDEIACIAELTFAVE